MDKRLGKEELYQTGAGTLMGRLLRRFWQPIALSEEVAAGRSIKVRVMGEDLTLYRGESGTPHLVGGRCAHRCTVLHTGVVRDEQISCMYHGWTYDGTGLCTRIPAESKPRVRQVRISAYPVRDYCGLVFAYFGEDPTTAFELPRKDVFEDPNRYVVCKREIWDCNWFQQVENSLDAVHLSFAHMWGIPGQFGSMISGGGELPELSYVETASGLRQTARRSNGNVRISDWTFPNNNHILAPGPTRASAWGHVSVWAVPIDDTKTMRYRLFSVAETDPALREKIHRDQDYDPGEHAPALFAGQLSGIPDQGLISAQDYVAVRGQGAIVDREAENLSTSDAGIIHLRRIFLRELEALRLGRPLKHWSKLDEKVELQEPPAPDAPLPRSDDRASVDHGAEP